LCLDAIDAQCGEMTDDLLEEFDSLEEEFKTKVNSALLVVTRFRAQAESDKSWAESIRESAKRLERQADNLEEWVIRNMRALDIRKVETESFSTVKIGKASQRVSVENEAEFLSWVDDAGFEAAQYVETVKDVRLNKKEIKAALNAGESMPGVRLVDGKTPVRYAGKK
jgi:hypothetical protein